jgi:hypothetical protein
MWLVTIYNQAYIKLYSHDIVVVPKTRNTENLKHGMKFL